MLTRGKLEALDDDVIVVLAQQQLPYQTRAYTVLMQRYQRKIYAFCLKNSGHCADAEDITQDVMLKIFHSLKKFERKSKLSTWIFSIASHTCLDYFRKHQRSWALHDNLDDVQIPAGNDAVREKVLVEKVLGILEEHERLVINLYYTAGFTFEEIADILNLSGSAVKMRYYRGMEKMRQMLKLNEESY